MKKLLILTVLIVLGSCKNQNNEIELITPSSEYYLFINKDFSPDGKLLADVYKISDEQVKKVSLAIDEAKKILQKSEQNSGDKNSSKVFPKSYKEFVYTLFIDEMGKINKVVVVNSPSSEINKQLVREMEDWEMVKYQRVDKPTKYSINWKFSLFVPKGKNYYSLHNSNLKVGEIINLPNKDEYFVTVEEMPSPIGGIRAIQEKVRYPEIAKRAGVQGRVYVKAYIDEEGNVVSTEVLKGIGSGIDEAAVKAIESVKFTPGRQKGKPVKVQVSIPIMFKLN